MGKESFFAIFLAVIIVTGLFFMVTVNFSSAQSSAAFYIISGYVSDPSGNLVSDAFVYNVNSTGQSFGPGCYSDFTGFYYMAVPAGTYTLVVRGLTGSGLIGSEKNIVVNSDVIKNVTLVSGFKISGYVLDSYGRAVQGVQVTSYNSSWAIPVANVDSSGYYETYAPAGTYTFTVWPRFDTNLLTYIDAAVEVNSDMTKNIVMDYGFKVSGNVRYCSGDVVPGVSIFLTNSSGYTFTVAWRSISSGYYFNVVPAGTYTISARFLGSSVTSYCESNFIVNGDVTKDITLIEVPISPTSITLDLGQSQLFTAAPTGGSDTYTTYAWYVNGSIKSAQSNASFNFSPTLAGSYLITAKVTDSLGAISSRSITATVTVNSDLKAPTISTSKSIIYQNQTSILSSTSTSTGTAPYSYQWYAKAPTDDSYSPITCATSSNYNFVTSRNTPTGVWSFILKITDSASTPVTVASAETCVTVNPTLKAPTITATHTTIFQGCSSTLTSSVNSGIPSYTYKWYSKSPSDMLFSAINNADSDNYCFVTSPSSPTGVWSFKVQVADATGEIVNSTELSITVNPTLTVTVFPMTATLDLGQSQLFTATPNGGSGTYISYQWYVNGAAQPGQTGPTFNYHPTTTGTYSITVTVTDSSGGTSSQSPNATAKASTTSTPTSTSTITPTPEPTITPSSTTTPTPTMTITTTTTPTASITHSTQPTLNPQLSPTIPEFPTWIILPLSIAIALTVTILSKKRAVKQSIKLPYN